MSLGVQGEEIATNYLKNKGYKILERNFRCNLGEIDIVACMERTLVFIEVKTRTSLMYGLPCESVGRSKRIHIRKAAALYAVKNRVININQRIDIIEILYMGEKAYIRHTENAF